MERIIEGDKAMAFFFFSLLLFSFCNNNKAKDLVEKRSRQVIHRD